MHTTRFRNNTCPFSFDLRLLWYLHNECHLWSRNCQPLRSTRVHPGFYCGSCYSIISFMCMFCRSLIDLLSFSLWSLCCLFFFDLQILITSLVSSTFLQAFHHSQKSGKLNNLKKKKRKKSLC